MVAPGVLDDQLLPCMHDLIRDLPRSVYDFRAWSLFLNSHCFADQLQREDDFALFFYCMEGEINNARNSVGTQGVLLFCCLNSRLPVALLN